MYAGLPDAVQQDHHALGQLATQLQDYLETKRIAVPAFYRLSDNALLNLIERCANSPSKAVQCHVSAMWPGVGQLETISDGPGKGWDVCAVSSVEGERLALVKPVKVAPDPFVCVLSNNQMHFVHAAAVGTQAHKASDMPSIHPFRCRIQRVSCLLSIMCVMRPCCSCTCTCQTLGMVCMSRLKGTWMPGWESWRQLSILPCARLYVLQPSLASPTVHR